MDVQPLTLDNEAEARAYLTDLLEKPELQSMDVVEQRCTLLIKNPTIQAYFLTTGAKMLAELKGQS